MGLNLVQAKLAASRSVRQRLLRCIDHVEPLLLGQHRILLVDDNEDVRLTSADMLEELGYRVVQAADGFEALDRLAEDPDLEVMVTDIRMPGMSGFELCDLASARHRDLKFVMMSGYFTPQETTRRLVRKPFRTVDLDKAIREALGSA